MKNYLLGQFYLNEQLFINKNQKTFKCKCKTGLFFLFDHGRKLERNVVKKLEIRKLNQAQLFNKRINDEKQFSITNLLTT